MVKILRAGSAIPATLKPVPVSEITVAPEEITTWRITPALSVSRWSVVRTD